MPIYVESMVIPLEVCDTCFALEASEEGEALPAHAHFAYLYLNSASVSRVGNDSRGGPVLPSSTLLPHYVRTHLP